MKSMTSHVRAVTKLSKAGLGAGEIAGIVVGCVFGVPLLGTLLAFLGGGSSLYKHI